jgi:hypothetical protein
MLTGIYVPTVVLVRRNGEMKLIAGFVTGLTYVAVGSNAYMMWTEWKYLGWFGPAYLLLAVMLAAVATDALRREWKAT